MIELGRRHRPSKYAAVARKRADLLQKSEGWGTSQKAREKAFQERLALLLEADL